MDNNNKLDEASALKLVSQEHQISKLQGTMAAAESDIDDMQMRLKSQQRRLSSAQMAVGLQKAIVRAQQSFDKDEAEVFQQGADNLVIRLKKMAFASGRAELPQESLPLLTKVNNVITELNAKEVSVEGHTDSIGSEKLNLKLSQRRAEIVADYLRSNANGQYEVDAKGFGFARPIASNKSKEGRAQNRRVDVVIKAVPQNASQLTEL
jgi:outer membrane protein OmpA-like peptidoglycan-associated protein